jgi:predicted transcriptional regulator
MATAKQEVMDMLSRLPPDVSYDEIMAEIYFKQKVNGSLEQIEKGQIVSHEEAKARLSKWVE